MAFVQKILPLAVLLPLPFLAAAPLLGGSFGLVALIYLTVFSFLLDKAVQQSGPVEPDSKSGPTPATASLPLALAVVHFVLLPFAVLSLAGPAPGSLAGPMVAFLAFAVFFGSVSTANAHELIHRGDIFSRAFGKWVFISLLFGHHTSAHLYVHHVHAATPADPNTARLNESFYRFFRRCWIGSFRAGLDSEIRRLALRGRGPLHVSNPYLIYFAGAATFLALAYVLGGLLGLAIYVGLAFAAQVQLLLSDYVQHYGLERRLLSNGKYQPVGVQHCWNAPHIFSAALMMNAPRHSDHHTHPDRPYSALRLLDDAGAPLLPHSLPAMSCLALVPRVWKRVMNPRVAAWVRIEDEKLKI